MKGSKSIPKDLSFDDFYKNLLVQDAVIRNLEIIGRAVKHLPRDVQKSYPDVEWKKIAGLRDILIHAYFRIDHDIVWDVITNKIPVLKQQILWILSKKEKMIYC